MKYFKVSVVGECHMQSDLNHSAFILFSCKMTIVWSAYNYKKGWP